MPIAAEEFEAGQVDAGADVPDAAPGGEYEPGRNRVLALLDENPDAASTERAVLLGVDFDESDDPATVRQSYDSDHETALGDQANEVVDVDDVAASTTLGDADDALTALVADGAVERADVTADGESRTYYCVARS